MQIIVNHTLFELHSTDRVVKVTLLNKMSSPNAMHFPIKMLVMNLTMLLMMPCSDILEFNSVHQEVLKKKRKFFMNSRSSNFDPPWYF